jgi:5,10-methylenetetrahydrofolate reductase
MLKSRMLLAATVITMMHSACTNYVPVSYSPSVDTFREIGTTNVLVTQDRGSGVVGWHVIEADMDSVGLHGSFHPMDEDLADKIHHLRKPSDALRQGRV